MDTTENHSKAKTIWLLIIIFMLGVSNTAWGLFYYKQNLNSDQLSSEIKALNIEKTTLNGQISSLKSSNKEISSEAKKDEIVWREIPELGIKYEIAEDTKDFTYGYFYDQNPLIQTSTISLTDSSPSTSIDTPTCSVKDPVGVIHKLTEKDLDKMNVYVAGSTLRESTLNNPNNKKLIKKLGENYFYLAPTKLDGSTRCSQEKFNEALTTAQKVFDSLTTI